jgi:hypothetical protein
LAEALAVEPAQAAPDLLGHPLGQSGAARPVGTQPVALDADVDPGIEDERDRQRVPAARQLDPALAVGCAHVGGVDHRQPAVLQPLLGDGADQVEGVGGDRLVGLVVGDQAAAVVRGDHLARQEMLGGEGRLARAGRADQHDQAEVRDRQLGGVSRPHRVNTAIWVGAPCSSLAAPMSLSAAV